MRLMGLESVAPKPDTSRPNEEHPVYPYLLRGLTISRANQVWASDITYIPLRTFWLQRNLTPRRGEAAPVPDPIPAPPPPPPPPPDSIAATSTATAASIAAASTARPYHCCLLMLK